MKTTIKSLSSFVLILVMLVPAINTFAGNKQRIGSAGAQELLINPWSRSAGWGNASVSCVKGIEATFANIAGLAFTNKTELGYTHTNWLVGTDISINAFGIGQKVGPSGVLGISVMSMDMGVIERTTNENPDGGIGTFHPTYSNISLSYAREFSNSIYGGITLKIISGGIDDVTASGVAIDAGIQYVTGEQRQIHFGITMKNWGPTMKYTGDGLSFQGATPPNDVEMTLLYRSEDFELPSMINLGAAYDFNFGVNQRLTIAGAFISNSFSKDQFSVGMEYSYKNILQIRGGYVYEEGIKVFGDDYETRTTVFTGPTAGVSLLIPLNQKNGSNFALDYSYRATQPFSGVHSIGAKISI